MLFILGNNQKPYPVHKQQQQQLLSSKQGGNEPLNSNDLVDLSNNNYDQSFLLKKQHFQQQQQQKIHQQQQQQNRLLQIENEIQNTYAFYVKNLNERRDYLLKEFHNIVQFIINQNQKSKQKQYRNQLHKNNGSDTMDNHSESDFMLDSDSLSESSKNNDLQSLINNYLMSIDFVTNLPAIQNSIYNTFGHIRYNSNTSNSMNNNNVNSTDSPSFGQHQQQVPGNVHSNNSYFYKPKPIGTSSSSSPSAYNNNGGETTTTSGYSSASNNQHQFLNQPHGNTELLIDQFVNNISNGHKYMIGSTNNNNGSSMNERIRSSLNSYNSNNNSSQANSADVYNNNNNNNSLFQFNDDSAKSSKSQKQAISNSKSAGPSLSSTGTSWSSVVAANVTSRSTSVNGQPNSSVDNPNLVLLTESNNNSASAANNNSSAEMGNLFDK